MPERIRPGFDHRDFPVGQTSHEFTKLIESHNLAARLRSDALETPEPLSLLDLRGLGKEHWKGIEPAAHVDNERGAWD